MVEVYGELLCARCFCQSAGSRPLAATASISAASASVTTSASRPSTTERACLPEPPCDWLMVTVSPVFCFQCAANAGLYSA